MAVLGDGLAAANFVPGGADPIPYPTRCSPFRCSPFLLGGEIPLVDPPLDSVAVSCQEEEICKTHPHPVPEFSTATLCLYLLLYPYHSSEAAGIGGFDIVQMASVT